MHTRLFLLFFSAFLVQAQVELRVSDVLHHHASNRVRAKLQPGETSDSVTLHLRIEQGSRPFFKHPHPIPKDLKSPTLYVWQSHKELHSVVCEADSYETRCVVRNIRPHGTGAQAGLQVGDWILSVDGKPATLASLFGKRPTANILSIMRAASPLEIELPPVASGLQLIEEPIPMRSSQHQNIGTGLSLALYERGLSFVGNRSVKFQQDGLESGRRRHYGPPLAARRQ
jgi:hypothetical protein